MDHKQLTDLRARIARTLQARRITEALNLLLTMASATSAPWSITDEIERLRSDYDRMASYALDGADDPARHEIFSGIASHISALADRMTRAASTQATPTLYFESVRLFTMRPGRSIADTAAALAAAGRDIAKATFAGDSPDSSLRRAQEELQTELFRRVWVQYPLSGADVAAVKDHLAAESTPIHQRLHIISAILLGLMEYHDPRRMELLLSIYMEHAQDSPEEAMRALAALITALWRHRDKQPGAAFAARLAAAAEMPSWAPDVKLVTLALLRCRDTESLTRTLTEEVIPSMLKLRPDIYRKLSDPDSENPLDPAGMAESNPEWEEMLEKSGLAKKLRKLTEMQEQGADVMMATFQRLKTFPFFHEIANWFLPFYTDHSSIGNTSPGMAEMIAAAPFICGSDKYSFMLSLDSIPADKREAVASQFEGYGAQAAEMAAGDFDDEGKRRESIAVNYVRDLYRFYRLFRRKGEFDGSFFDTFNPVEVPVLGSVFADDDALMLVGEFFFTHNFPADALRVFDAVSRHAGASAMLCQKRGFCHQKLGHTAEAVTCYEQAEMLDPTNRWTWRKLAACHRLAGCPEKALPYYERLAQALPDDLTITLQHANALAETGDYARALSLYFKVEFLDPDSARAVRPIGWTAFLTGDYTTARRYFEKALSQSPSGADLVNLGHLEMATGHYRDAIEVYRRALDMPGYDKSAFARAMQEDLKHLRAAGVDDLLTGIVIDKLLAG